MNQPTREEHEDLKHRVERLEQRTEPIQVTVASSDVLTRLDNHTALLQEQDKLIKEVLDRQDRLDDLGIKTFNEVAKINTELAVFKTDVQKRFDAIAEVQRLILERLPEKK